MFLYVFDTFSVLFMYAVYFFVLRPVTVPVYGKERAPDLFPGITYCMKTRSSRLALCKSAKRYDIAGLPRVDWLFTERNSWILDQLLAHFLA